jgi:hypothetical protein
MPTMVHRIPMMMTACLETVFLPLCVRDIYLVDAALHHLHGHHQHTVIHKD